MAVYRLRGPRLEHRWCQRCNMAVGYLCSLVAPLMMAFTRLSAHIGHRPVFISYCLKFILVGLFGLNIIATMLLTQASMHNYPGSEALRHLNDIVQRPDFRRESCRFVSCPLS